MASPVNIRVMALFPFPALVTGAAPIKLTKANGIWTVALDVADLNPSVPLTAAYPTDFVIVYDSVAKTYSKVSLATLGLGGFRLQRFTNANPVAVAGNDQIINFGVAAPATSALPGSGTRSGIPLTFNNSGNNLSAINKLRISAAAGESIAGQAFIDMTTPGECLTLVPYNDGTNTGWFVNG